MHDLITILYVKDQQKSKSFYEQLLQSKPSLDVPGMTEFNFGVNFKLGLMPEEGISKILTPAVPHPASESKAPRCELYFRVTDASTYLKRAIRLGAKMVSPLQKREWAETVGYVADFDGHILAFAEK